MELYVKILFDFFLFFLIVICFVNMRNKNFLVAINTFSSKIKPCMTTTTIISSKQNSSDFN